MPDGIVIIPTYNEKENIERIIKNVFSLQRNFHVLVVDDNSPDKTGGIVKSMQPEFKDQLFLIEREGKSGLGTAYIEGFKWVLEREYKIHLSNGCRFFSQPERFDPTVQCVQ